MCQLYTKRKVPISLHTYTNSNKDRQAEEMAITIEPGDLILFNGDNLWHMVSPMTETPNQRRVVLTLEYVTDETMSWIGRWISNIKDGLLYFGIGSVLGFNNGGEQSTQNSGDTSEIITGRFSN
jgi:hypothetical protein